MAENERKTYRIRTAVGNEAPASINVNLTQTYDVVDVLSLELNQKNFYKMPAAGYGVILGRVIANGGFGIPNAKVSVFIPYDSNLLFEENNFLYRFGSPASKDSEGIRYNLLPRRVDDDCHQDVGTMPEKEYLLDNKDLIQVFDKYYKYTAVTNEAGDYFIYGVPVGTQTVHVDLDLSDIGVLSQRPRDMIYKGYNINQFESPNKFKKDKNLNSLAQIFTQDKVVTVYSFWGDTSEDPTVGTLTRCDISIDYKFEPTCVFMGSIVSDTGNRAISQRCVPDDEIGKMSELVTGEGKIEMIRKTFDGKVEEFSVKGNNLIDGDGVWCYQIPMNLDYVVTDEFGNMVPTDNPEKGIATRTRVRFRISMNETENDETARKRARFLVPNNPKLTEDYPDFKKSHKADYEFGTFTKEESYRDLFWNKVYTVKSYIPRLQKAKAMRRRVHTGIKNVNHAGANNPFPFNNLFIRLTFLYRFLCVLLKRFCVLVLWVNNVLGVLGYALYYLARFNIFLEKIVLFGSDENYGYILNPIGKIIKKISQYFDEAELPVLGHPLQYIAKLLLNAVEHLNVKLDNFCDDGNFTNQPYYLGTIKRYKDLFTDPDKKVELPDIGYSFPEDTMITNWIGNGNVKLLFNCIENQLVQDQECTSFNFNNDWVNGVLYAPMWYRKVRSKKRILFNLIPIKAKDKWCNGEAEVPTVFNKLSLCQTCAQRRAIANDGLSLLPLENDIINRPYSSPTNFNKDSVCYGYKCHKKTVSFITINKGLIIPKETILGENVYYYKAVEYDESHLMSQEKPDEKGDVKMLFATDIVLLGSLNECDSDGVPQFFKTLESTTYNMPPDLLLMDYESNVEKLKYEPKYTDSDTSEDETEIGIGDEGLENILEDFNDIASIDNISNVYTDKTGADWGNYGRDQVVNPSDNTSIIYTTEAENPDYGGLFYGLTCFSTYTKPKSCINLSRICEYGVSLDETQEYPNYNEKDSNGQYRYETMAPDGFISYDELYEKDGRAMFATMNGNNLRTKINPKNGFPVYDFIYLYPENFDGSLRQIMQPLFDKQLPFPQSENYAVETSSEAYMRFRYGRYVEDSPVVKFYKSTIKQGFYPTSIDKTNTTRFPKYENSFYFYFGLKPGSTAIDKFRTQYYSECRDTDGEQPVVSVDFEANEWCSEVTMDKETPFAPGNGWITIDATYLDVPYDIKLLNMSGEPEYDLVIEGVEKPKVIITTSEENLPSEPDYLEEGYEILMDGENTYGILNGVYRLTIVDANGYEFSQNINFIKEYISANVSRSAFRYKNEELETVVNELGYGYNTGDKYLDIAQLGGQPPVISQDEGLDMSNREIGGFIKVTEIAQEGDRFVDFEIDIEPLFNIHQNKIPNIISGTQTSVEQIISRNGIIQLTDYYGSKFELYQDEEHPDTAIPEISVNNKTLMRPHGFVPEGETVFYCPYTYDMPQYVADYDSVHYNTYQTNGGRYDFRFGVPKGGEKYRVTVTMLCKKDDGKYYKSRNGISTDIAVPEPIPFKLLINKIDYELIKHFRTGWAVGNEFPVNYSNWGTDPSIVGTVQGWLDISEIDGLEELAPVTTKQLYSYIQDTDEKLAYTRYDNPLGLDIKSYYNWNGKYRFNACETITGIEDFDEVPDTLQNEDVTLIRVLNPDVVGDYEYYEWDETNSCYVELDSVNPVTVISMEVYFEHCSVEMQNSIISKFNQYIALRKNLVEQMKTAFILTIPSGATFMLSTDFETYEVPVKTLIYDAPDIGVNITSSDFEPISEQMEQQTCYGITRGTITGKLIDEYGDYYFNPVVGTQPIEYLGAVSYQPTNNGNGDYKKPWLLAIENALHETLPSNIGDLVLSTTPSQANQMFGVHVIDKRLTLVYNSWACMENWPYYVFITRKNENIDDEQYLGKYYTLPGLFAGFVLNGKPEGYDNDFETQFIEQRVDNENVLVKTINVDTVTNEVDETRLPVVRLIHREAPESNIYRNYTINQPGSANQNPTFEINGIQNGIFHYLLNSVDSYLQIIDKSGTHKFFFDDEVIPIDFSRRKVAIGEEVISYNINVTFDSGYQYAFYKIDNNTNPLNRYNPVYEKMRDTSNNQVLTFQQNEGNTPNMQFWCNTFPLTSNNVFSITNINLNKRLAMYCVRFSMDGQRRAISKTYDLTPLEYYISCFSAEPSPGHQDWIYRRGVKICMNVGENKYFNYLKYYGYTIEFINDNEVVESLDCVPYNGLPATTTINITTNSIFEQQETQDYPNTYITMQFIRKMPSYTEDEIEEYKNFLKGCKVYLTDASGLTHEMVQIPDENNYIFPHNFT